MRDLCLLGVDPGLTGALAFYFPRFPDRIAVYDMPVVNGQVNPHEVGALLDQYLPNAAVVELVGSMPGQGLSSTFKFGVAWGLVRGVIAKAKIPDHLPTPGKWKKHFSLDSDKEKSRALALQLWPACAESFKLKKHDGRAEAALLARYGADVPFANLVRNNEANMGLFG